MEKIIQSNIDCLTSRLETARRFEAAGMETEVSSAVLVAAIAAINADPVAALAKIKASYRACESVETLAVRLAA